MQKNIRQGDTVLDIGGNIGIVTVLMSDLVGPSGNVYTFEPNPELCKHLSECIRHNKIRNVTIHPIGLGSKKESLELQIPKYNKGMGSFSRCNEGRLDFVL